MVRKPARWNRTDGDAFAGEIEVIIPARCERCGQVTSHTTDATGRLHCRRCVMQESVPDAMSSQDVPSTDPMVRVDLHDRETPTARVVRIVGVTLFVALIAALLLKPFCL